MRWAERRGDGKTMEHKLSGGKKRIFVTTARDVDPISHQGSHEADKDMPRRSLYPLQAVAS